MTGICRVYNLIPIKEIDRVFRESSTASAEMDSTFLCFEDVYFTARELIDESWTVLDLGCAYAPQAFIFRDCAQYIGVDAGMKDDIHFQTDNMIFHHMSIQKFIAKHLHELDLEKTLAICSAVPDAEAQQLVRDTFPHNLVWYPGGLL